MKRRLSFALLLVPLLVGVLEKQIANIVSAIANGEKSGSIKGALADYEKELTTSRQIITDLEREDRLNPILRSEKQVTNDVRELTERLQKSPVSAREALRRLHRGKPIILVWDEAGYYRAKSEVFCDVLLVEAQRAPGSDPSRPSVATVAGARRSK